MRYDYLQPWHEAKNRFAFVNPNLVNPVTGNLGVIQFGGYGPGPNANYTPYICQCSTPVHPYNKNIEPQLALAYSPTRTTVIRSNFGVITTHAGGTGGHASATAGPGNNSEYSYTQVWQGTNSTSPPSFFLNPGIIGNPQNSLFAPGQGSGSQLNYYSVPPFANAGNLINPLSTTGNYVIPNNPTFACASPDSTGTYCNPSTQNFVDLYYGGRGPQFLNYNIGIQQMINKSAVLSINYSGSQTHFLPGGSGRGAATNAISPDCLQTLGSYGTVSGNTYQATDFLTMSPANLTAQQASTISALCPAYKKPYAGFAGPDATVAQALRPFPQFGNLTDIWGATGNSNYNALQVSVIQRPWHNLSGFFNYTWSKSIDDVGNHRTQFPVGPQDGNFTRSYTASGIDRGLGTFDQRNNFNATFNYVLPIGRGQRFLANNKILGSTLGGWSISGIQKIRQGTPLQITVQEEGTNGCLTASQGYQGTCMPDYNPNVTPRQARINGEWGRAPGANAGNIQTIQYLNQNAFQCPGLSTNCQSFALGNVARSAPDGLRGPGWKDTDIGIRRTFNLIESGTNHVTFQVEADVTNVTNSTYFSLAAGATGWDTCPANATVQTCSAANYGTIGGQNSQVPPRDVQLSGRFRF